jgi:purine-binding chemotaxis protein CheW
MSDEQYLIFSLHGSLYGIDAVSVREICWLPELYSLATAPADILGMFNWRSQMLPVMHLDLRFGRKFSGCSLTNRIIIVEWQNTCLGIVAHDVYDVELLSIESVNIDLIQGRQIAVDKAFITGIAQLNDRPVICLNLDRLIREPDAILALSDGENVRVSDPTEIDFYSRCYPQASMAEREIFDSRTTALKTSVTEAQVINEKGVLVVQLGSEYLGFPLELIVDVDAIDRFPVSPVPATPNYIVGQINWRGSILPVLEIGHILQLPIQLREEFVVVEIDKVKIGIMVDRIFDVSYLANSEIDMLPMTVDRQNQTYLRGVTKYADGLMYLVELKESIEREFLSVAV